MNGGATMKVRVPASTANMGSGFDTVGMALQMYLDVEATVGGEQNNPYAPREEPGKDD